MSEYLISNKHMNFEITGPEINVESVNSARDVKRKDQQLDELKHLLLEIDRYVEVHGVYPCGSTGL